MKLRHWLCITDLLTAGLNDYPDRKYVQLLEDKAEHLGKSKENQIPQWWGLAAHARGNADAHKQRGKKTRAPRQEIRAIPSTTAAAAAASAASVIATTPPNQLPAPRILLRGWTRQLRAPPPV